MKVTDILTQGKYTFSVELVPPRNGTALDKFYESASKFKNAGVDFLSVTKGAGGSLRGGTLPITYFLKEKTGLEAIAHFTCIDKLKTDIENELLDHYHFGIKNILALRGDKPDIAPGVKNPNPESAGDYKYAHQLVGQIKNLNQGKYLARENFDEGKVRSGFNTDFCIGVAAHPEEKDMETAVEHLSAKVDAGADYAITQMIFKPELYNEFVGKARDSGINIPILPGIRPFTKYKWAVLCEEKFGVPVPQKYKDALKGLDNEQSYKKAVELSAELCNEFRDAGAPGAHLFVVFDVDLALEVLDLVKK